MANTQGDQNIQARIRAEYHEMPGMRLTLPQAARLFNLDPARCGSVLDALVRDGALRTDGRHFLCRNIGRPDA